TRRLALSFVCRWRFTRTMVWAHCRTRTQPLATRCSLRLLLPLRSSVQLVRRRRTLTVSVCTWKRGRSLTTWTLQDGRRLSFLRESVLRSIGRSSSRALLHPASRRFSFRESATLSVRLCSHSV